MRVSLSCSLSLSLSLSLLFSRHLCRVVQRSCGDGETRRMGGEMNIWDGTFMVFILVMGKGAHLLRL